MKSSQESYGPKPPAPADGAGAVITSGASFGGFSAVTFADSESFCIADASIYGDLSDYGNKEVGERLRALWLQPQPGIHSDMQTLN